MKLSKEYLKQLIKEELEEAEQGQQPAGKATSGKPAAGSALGVASQIAPIRTLYKPLTKHGSIVKMQALIQADPLNKAAVAEVVLTQLLGVDPKELAAKKAILKALLGIS